jgi:hypothetical protein
MVCRLNPEDCHCATCDGGTRAPEGYFGGTWCPCECHALTGEEREKYVAKVTAERKAEMEKEVEQLLSRMRPK